MEQSPRNTQELIDTTDSLEAVSASKSMKNFLFLILFLALVIPQMIFWLDRIGLIDKDCCTTCTDCLQIEIDEPQVSVSDQKLWAPIYLAADTDIAKEAEKVADQVEKTAKEAETVNVPEGIVTEQSAQGQDIPASDETAEAMDAEGSDELSAFKISCSFARGLVAICNYLLLSGGILYSLTILLCLKISLTGRLGGINHITRSFFLSLFLLVLLVPWQIIMPKVLIGCIWLPGELLCGGWVRAESSIFWKVLFYGRFCGLWVVAMWLLLWAQVRSAKWAHATLRRLGVVR